MTKKLPKLFEFDLKNYYRKTKKIKGDELNELVLEKYIKSKDALMVLRNSLLSRVISLQKEISDQKLADGCSTEYQYSIRMQPRIFAADELRKIINYIDETKGISND